LRPANLYGGIKELVKPGALFIVDVITDINAVREAKKLGIPVVALVDTNADPTPINYPIPSNDDATKAINLILEYVKQAIEEGKARVKKPADKTENTEKPATKPAEKKPTEAEEK
jgi:small subunit ribosomal protein S2